MEIFIQNKSVTPTFVFDKLYLRNVSVTPYVGATLYIQLHFIDPSHLLTEDMCTLYREIKLTTEEYNAWGTDDYLINIVLTKLNLQKQV